MMFVKTYKWTDIADQKHTIDIAQDNEDFQVLCWTERDDEDELMWKKRFATVEEATAEALRFAPAGSEVTA